MQRRKNMANIKLAPPWITYVSEVEQMFKYDPEVHVVYDNDAKSLKLYVDEEIKADALALLLPDKKDYGTVTLTISVIPANKPDHKINYTSVEDVYNSAFNMNPVCSFVKTITGIFSNNLVYVVFAKRVVQYFNDDLGDIYGQRSTLYESIAKNIFCPQEGVYYCTDAKDIDCEESAHLGSPLGEWP